MKTLNCLYFNSRSIANKITDLRLLLSLEKYSLILITETWLNSKYSNEQILGNLPYELIRCDRTTKGGGSAILVLNSIPFNVCQILKNKNSEITAIDLLLPGLKNIRIIVVYRSTAPEDIETSNKFFDSLSTLMSVDYECVLIGDFNMPGLEWKNSKPSTFKNKKEALLRDLINNFNLFQHVKENTRENKILDLVFTSKAELIDNLRVNPPFSKSDHNMISFDLDFYEQHNKNKQNKFRDYKKADFVSLNRFFKSIDWISLFSHTNDINEIYESFCITIKEGVDKFVPFCKNQKSKNLPKQIQRLLCVQKDLWAKNKHINDKKKYLTVTHRLHKQIRKFFKNKESKIVMAKSKKFKYVGSFLKNKKNFIPVLIDKNNEPIIADKDKTELLSKQFHSVFNRSTFSNDNIEQTFSKTKLEFTPIMVDDVIAALNKLPNKNNTSPDNIPNILLKNCSNTLAFPLHYIFTLSLMTKKIPTIWKSSLVCPIPKISNANKPQDFRPISLLCSTSKILETIIAAHIISHAKKHKIIPDEQHGYQNHKSVTTQLLEVIDDFSLAIENKQAIDIIYFDFAKAFDTIPHDRLLAKLESLGIGGALLEWLQDYLTDRTFRTKIRNAQSDKYEILSGVPQGSVLGPILFILYLHDLPKFCSTEHVQNKSFVDDLKAYHIYNKNNNLTNSPLQNFIYKLLTYSKQNGLSLAQNKCKVLRIGNVSPHDYEINGIKLEEVQNRKTIRDLGIYFDHSLKFQKHIDIICAKANKISFTLLKSLKSNKHQFLINMFCSYVRPILEFGSQIWNPFFAKDIQKIEKIQKRYLQAVYRRANFLQYNENITIPRYEELLKLYKLSSLKDRRQKTDLKTFHQHIWGKINIKNNNSYQFQQSITRGGNTKITHKPCKTFIRHNSFFIRSVREYNKLPMEIKKNNPRKFAILLEQFFDKSNNAS